MAYSFDGTNKVISCTSGTTSFAARDLYSRWKDWMTTGDNSKYLGAFETIGGDPIGGGEFVGDFYFIKNGWVIRPQEADHVLSITGNLLTFDGSSPFTSTLGAYNVSIRSKFSNLTNQIDIGGGGTSAADVADAVWDEALSGHSTSGTAGKIVATIESTVKFIKSMVMVIFGK